MTSFIEFITLIICRKIVGVNELSEDCAYFVHDILQNVHIFDILIFRIAFFYLTLLTLNLQRHRIAQYFLQNLHMQAICHFYDI